MRSRTEPVVLVAAMAWCILLYVSARGLAGPGIGDVGAYFFGDFAYPWRAQFLTDFSIHLLGVGAWMIWRTQSLLLGAIWALLAVCLGALFTLPFFAAALWRSSGNVAAVLLGDRAKTSRWILPHDGGRFT